MRAEAGASFVLVADFLALMGDPALLRSHFAAWHGAVIHVARAKALLAVEVRTVARPGVGCTEARGRVLWR